MSEADVEYKAICDGQPDRVGECYVLADRCWLCDEVVLSTQRAVLDRKLGNWVHCACLERALNVFVGKCNRHKGA
jgi:hypothetical protein